MIERLDRAYASAQIHRQLVSQIGIAGGAMPTARSLGHVFALVRDPTPSTVGVAKQALSTARTTMGRHHRLDIRPAPLHPFADAAYVLLGLPVIANLALLDPVPVEHGAFAFLLHRRALRAESHAVGATVLAPCLTKIRGLLLDGDAPR
jgi:hypothetical protein